MLFFLQRDSPSAGCTRQTPPNRVSADSPSRILPGDIMVSLRFPPPEKLQRCEWSGRNSWIYFGRSLEGCGIYFFLKAAGGTRVQAVIFSFFIVFLIVFLVNTFLPGCHIGSKETCRISQKLWHNSMLSKRNHPRGRSTPTHPLFHVKGMDQDEISRHPTACSTYRAAPSSNLLAGNCGMPSRIVINNNM